MGKLRWSKEEADKWDSKQPWLVGCNFIPSTAINQLEMWQEETFDEETIGRELSWAAASGFNTVRVYLHDLLWQADADGFKDKISCYLKVAGRSNIRTLFVIFDDCWNENPRTGKQPDPVPGVHNSGWVQSPGSKVVANPTTWVQLERYVQDIIGAFAEDRRVLMWDLYNEPGNNGLEIKSLSLLEEVFKWARAAGPTQPLTTGVWCNNKEITDFQLRASDVITFHNYNDTQSLIVQIRELKTYGRPIICTEYMARTRGSCFETHLPIFKRENVGCCNWGLVSGKTQTIYPWGSEEGAPEPSVWFHDVLRKDGSSFKNEEVELIKNLTSVSQ